MFYVEHKPDAPRSVLLLEDSFVSGSQAFSAAAALKSAGYDIVGIACLARWFNPSKIQDEAMRARVTDLLERTQRELWSLDVCGLCLRT
jgi:orotate phosphoribosyltransferase